MPSLLGKIKKFFKDDAGATAVEYGVLIALIIAACVVIIGVLGGQINDAFNNVSTQLTGAGVVAGG